MPSSQPEFLHHSGPIRKQRTRARSLAQSGEERQAECWNPSCLLSFSHLRLHWGHDKVPLLRFFDCRASITIQQRGYSCDSSFSMSGPPSLRQRSPVSSRPCTTLLGWYRNQWDALLGVLGVKANCGLSGYGFRVVPELSTTTTASTTTTLPLSLPSICCVHLPVFPFFIAGFVLVQWRSYS